MATETVHARGKLFDYVETSAKRVKAKGNSYSWINAYAFSIVSLFAYTPTQKKRKLRKQEIARFKSIGLKFCHEKQKTHYRGTVKGPGSSFLDTQYFLLYNKDAVVLAFRGSENASFGDDANQWTKAIADWVGTDGNILHVTPWGKKAGAVHQGFFQGYETLRKTQRLVKRVKDCMNRVRPEKEKSRKRRTPRALFVTGHSLGGAVGQAAAFGLNKSGRIPIRGIYTYGAPRFASDELKKTWNKQFKARAHRWVNDNDMVTGLPPVGLFHHTGRYHHLDEKDGLGQKITVRLDRGAHLPRLFSAKNHGINNYNLRIWNHFPYAKKKKLFRTKRKAKSFRPREVYKRGLGNKLVTKDGRAVY